MPQGRADHLARLNVPDASSPIVAGGHSKATIGAETNCVDGRFMPQPQKHLSGGGFPQARRAVATGRAQTPAIGAEGDVIHLGAMPAQSSRGFTITCVPETGGAIPTRGSEAKSIR